MKFPMTTVRQAATLRDLRYLLCFFIAFLLTIFLAQPLFGQVDSRKAELELGLYPNTDVSLAPSDLVLQQLAMQGKLYRLKFQLRRKPETLNQADQFGRTALHYASAGGYVEIVSYLLGKGGDLYDVDHYGQTALHYAAEWGHAKVAAALLRHAIHRTDVDSSVEESTEGSDTGHPDFEYESAYASLAYLDALDDEGRTALDRAAIYGEQEVAEFLLKAGAGSRHRDNYDWNAADLAFKSGHIQLGEFLRAAESPQRQYFYRAARDYTGPQAARDVAFPRYVKDQAAETELAEPEKKN